MCPTAIRTSCTAARRTGSTIISGAPSIVWITRTTDPVTPARRPGPGKRGRRHSPWPLPGARLLWCALAEGVAEAGLLAHHGALLAEPVEPVVAAGADVAEEGRDQRVGQVLVNDAELELPRGHEEEQHHERADRRR